MSEENQQQNSERAGTERPPRARQSAAPRKGTGKSSYRTFRPDEHPEIPRVRRASLKQSKAEVLIATATDAEVDTETNEETTETPTPRVKPAHSNTLPPTVKRRYRETPPFTGLEKYKEQESDDAVTTSRPRRGPRAVTRHTPTSRPTRGPARSTSPSFWRRRKSRVLIGLLAILLLILTPFIAGFVHNLTTSHYPQSISTTSSVPISKLQSVPSNSHALVVTPPQTDHPAPPVLATAAYLLDADNETTLYAQNAFLHLPMLSTTKLMTAVVAVETGNLNQQITITQAMEHDIQQLSSDSALFGVKEGETYTLRDLLYGLLYVSGNDAALVIADALAGNVANFVAEMNQKAQQLGLNDTHFVNPHGLLASGQYSCARDLAVLGQYSLGIPVLQQISSGRVYHIPAGGKHGARVVLNENQFLWWFPGVDGGKTGYDGEKDFVQVISVVRNHHHLIGVVIHTNNWWTDMRDLMNYGFNTYTWVSPRDVDAAGQPIPYDNLWNYFASDTREGTVSLTPTSRYYIYTGYTVSGPILAYFDKNGGLKKFGFPTKMPTPSGKVGLAQQFEHGTIFCNLSNNQCSTV